MAAPGHRRWGRLALIILLLAGIGMMWVIFSGDRSLDVQAERVEPRNLTVMIQEQGRTRAREPYTVAAPLSSQLLRTPLREGDRVEAGQIIARIALAPENPRTEAAIRANLEAANARLQAAHSAVREAESQLDRAERESARRNQLFSQGMIGAEERDSFQQALDMARARAEVARATLRSNEAEVESARSQLIGIEEGSGGLLEIPAPVAGVVYQVYEKSERVVAAGTPLFLLSDGDAMELVIDLLTQQAVQVRPGDRILIDGWGGNQTLEGRVLYIEPEAFTKFSALGVEEQRVNIIGELESGQDILGAGYRVEASIIVWEGSDILSVPTSALFRRNAAWHVFVIREGQAHLQEVSLGQRSQDYAQVLDGVVQGESVIVFPSDQIADGVSVNWQ